MQYDAVAFLESLFRPAVASPADLPPDQRVLFEERAAIMEFDGGLPRAQAEQLALLDQLGASAAPPRHRSQPTALSASLPPVF